MDEYAREPCPWRIVDDTGGAFTLGLIGGSLFQGVFGMRNAPAGIRRRLQGGLIRAKDRAPMYGGQFAAWGMCFACFDCSLMYVRQKEDHWNSILSGAGAGFVLAARNGPAAMVASAFFGATILGFIEGVSFMTNKYFSEAFRPVDIRDAPQDPSALGPNAS